MTSAGTVKQVLARVRRLGSRPCALDRMVWEKERMLCGDLVFRLEGLLSDPWKPDEATFLFNKPRRMMEQYAAFWRLRDDFRPRRILELGIHHGASLVLWNEQFRPEVLIGVDLAKPKESRHFERYCAAMNGRIRTHWETDQSDRERLRRIVTKDAGTLDLVFDDASHIYRETRASFETLFPLVTPGGLYIIEDWSWACWEGLTYGYNPVGTELPALVFQLVEAAGNMYQYLVGDGASQVVRPLIANVTVYPDFVVVERGECLVDPSTELVLDRCITRSRQLRETLRYPPATAVAGE